MCAMNLRRIREARGLKQADLGELIGKDKSTISRAEAMHPTARLETYMQCAEALGVTLEDLFATELTPTKRAIVDMIQRLPDEMLEPVAALLKMATADGRVEE